MGKYKFLVDGKNITETTGLNDNVQLMYIINRMANELAEANRLKRVEIAHQYLSTKFDHRSFSYDEEGLDKLLEDQA